MKLFVWISVSVLPGWRTEERVSSELQTLVNNCNHYNTSKLQPQRQRSSWTLVCAQEYQFNIDPGSAHALMSARETDGLCEWGLFEGSKLTCDLGFDGWKDRWLESVRREVNRGMNCRSNRLEECEQLSNSETSRIKLQQADCTQTENICSSYIDAERPPFCCSNNPYTACYRLFNPWFKVEFEILILFTSINLIFLIIFQRESYDQMWLDLCSPDFYLCLYLSVYLCTIIYEFIHILFISLCPDGDLTGSWFQLNIVLL